MFHAPWISSKVRTLCFLSNRVIVMARGKIMDPKSTGLRIAEKRKEKGLNQIQLGEILNVSNRTVSKWEKGDGYPDITLLPDIADALGITIDELLTGETRNNENVINETVLSKKDKLLHEFKIIFIISLFLSIFSSMLGGITEAYCIWAFPILFYTHWEIMFAAVSLMAMVVSIMLFSVGVFRLHPDYTKGEIIGLCKRKGLILFIISAVFPIFFLARIIDFSRWGNCTVFIMAFVLIAVIALVSVLYKRIK